MQKEYFGIFAFTGNKWINTEKRGNSLFQLHFWREDEIDERWESVSAFEYQQEPSNVAFMLSE